MEPRCGRCAQRLPEGIARGQSCADCVTNSSGLAQVLALGDYGARSDWKSWILALKHGGRPDLSQPLGALLAERLKVSGNLGSQFVLVPVPLYFWRRLHRGYDQAALLARAVSQGAGAPWSQALYRRRSTVAQGSLHSRGRAPNVSEAFGLHPEAIDRVQGRNVYLVDDVYTSGATLRACARILRAGGARKVGALVLARAVRFA
ncbi:MAG: ComF family protein [Planctomycetota bacterium]|nr:ComF family protein [Planctomycetota bacterium]